VDDRRFDDLVRRVGRATSRRQLLKGLAGGAAAAFGLVRGRDVARAQCPAGQIRVAGGRCVCRATGRPPGPVGCPCSNGLTKCGTACVDLTTDPANCGDCGVVCSGATPVCDPVDGCTAAPPIDVNITLTSPSPPDTGIATPLTIFKAGQAYNFIVFNAGAIGHSFRIDPAGTLDPTVVPKATTINPVPAGTTDSTSIVNFVFPNTGAFQFACQPHFGVHRREDITVIP
jgi:hypothetical protein